MRLSIGRSCYDKKWRVVDMTWDALVAKLGTCQRTHESMSEYRAMTQEERSRVKDVGGFVGGVLMTDGKPGGRRSNANIADRCLLTLDADDARTDDWTWTGQMENWSLCAYSTHSHTPEKPKLRWVLPMTRTVTPDEYECLARTVAQRINIESMDVSTYQPARLMYWPSCPVDAAPFFAVRNGPVLDPDALLRETYGEGEAWKDRSLWPVSSKETRIIEHSQRRAGEPTEKPGIIGLFCRTYDVPRAIDAFLPDVYDECGTTGRYTYTKGSTGGGAVLYDNGALIYSHHSTDPATGRCLNAFDLVRIHKFGQLDWDAPEGAEVTQLPSYKARSDFAAALEEVRIQQAAETSARVSEDFADLALVGTARPGAGVLEMNEDGTLDDMSWASELELTRKGAPECTIGNALLYLTHDRGLAGAVAYNLFSCQVVKRRLMPWETGMLTETRAGEADSVDGRGWTDTDDAALRLYMEKLGITGSRIIDDALMVAAKKNAFHPVREYLTRLTWDGVERLDTMLIRWMGAEDSPYVRAVTRKWLTAGVARVMRPGCKFDNMLILVGPQGIGKSRLAGALARRWFLDGLPDFTSKDTLERIQGKWIVEVAELSAMRKSEVEDVKGFISRTTDTFRVAYGRNSGDFPRQSIFYGSTNSAEFLRDTTGNRRFWPVSVTGFDRGQLKGLDEEVDQLWAEAVVRWRAGEPLWLDDPTLWEDATAQQDLYTEDDGAEEMAGRIMEFLDKPLPANWGSLNRDERESIMRSELPYDVGDPPRYRDVVCLAELRNQMPGMRFAQPGESGFAGQNKLLGRAMSLVPGWARTGKTRRIPGYDKPKVYVRMGSEADLEGSLET